ncbi:hypothetical protein LXL04_004597 [Taraxacum kok-saghyz]
MKTSGLIVCLKPYPRSANPSVVRCIWQQQVITMFIVYTSKGIRRAFICLKSSTEEAKCFILVTTCNNWLNLITDDGGFLCVISSNSIRASSRRHISVREPKCFDGFLKERMKELPLNFLRGWEKMKEAIFFGFAITALNYEKASLKPFNYLDLHCKNYEFKLQSDMIIDSVVHLLGAAEVVHALDELGFYGLLCIWAKGVVRLEQIVWADARSSLGIRTPERKSRFEDAPLSVLGCRTIAQKRKTEEAKTALSHRRERVDAKSENRQSQNYGLIIIIQTMATFILNMNIFPGLVVRPVYYTEAEDLDVELEIEPPFWNDSSLDKIEKTRRDSDIDPNNQEKTTAFALSHFKILASVSSFVEEDDTTDIAGVSGLVIVPLTRPNLFRPLRALVMAARHRRKFSVPVSLAIVMVVTALSEG